MLGTRGIWEKGWKAVAVHGPTSGIGNFDQDEWQLFHTDEDRSEAHDLAAEHPEKLQAADRRLVRGGGASSTCCRSTTARRRDLALEPRPQPSRRARRTCTSRTRPRCRSRSPSTRAARSLQDPGRGRSHQPRRRGRDLRARLALRRPRTLPQGAEALVRLQLPRRAAGAAVRLRRARAREVRARHGVREGVARRARRGARHDKAPRRRAGRGRGADAHAAGAVHALRRRPLLSAGTRATPSAGSTRHPSPFKGGTILKVEVNVGDDSTSTWRRKPPR